MSALAVVSVRAVLAHEMFIKNALRGGQNLRVDLLGQNIHAGDFLKHDCVVDCLSGVFAPGEGTMVSADNAWYIDGIDTALCKGLHDYVAAPGQLKIAGIGP